RQRHCELAARQGQPDRHPDRDPRRGVPGADARIHDDDLAPFGRDRGHHDRRSRRGHERRSDQGRRTGTVRTGREVQPAAAHRGTARRRRTLRRPRSLPALRGLSRTQARTEADAALPSSTHSERTGSGPHTPRRGRKMIFDRPVPPRRVRSERGAASAEQFGAGGSGLCVLCSADGTLDLIELRLLEQLLPADSDHPPPSLTQPLLATAFPLELLPRNSGAEIELAEARALDDQPRSPVAGGAPALRPQRSDAARNAICGSIPVLPCWKNLTAAIASAGDSRLASQRSIANLTFVMFRFSRHCARVSSTLASVVSPRWSASSSMATEMSRL